MNTTKYLKTDHSLRMNGFGMLFIIPKIHIQANVRIRRWDKTEEMDGFLGGKKS
ncbi:MAG: hypothetical protein ACUBOA_02015 [Candidatus Loosdrechtia sp.]|uniref:hypothetical protein n=1 Tax=Candidatus Loosdrechtia sp. TaxID=3101272 RepID=UPI003A6647D2|nr:MAG: hypothetical protein QY305_07010 [Candidatus Jettenia sp. AMX2]